MAVYDAAASGRGDGRVLPETTPTAQALAALRDARFSAPDMAQAIDETIAIIETLRAEIVVLRYALTGRACIDEAKGVVMAERGGDEATAFLILKQVSQDTNVPLREVAKAIVYQAQDPD